jgi:hypothetical protein
MTSDTSAIANRLKNAIAFHIMLMPAAVFLPLSGMLHCPLLIGQLLVILIAWIGLHFVALPGCLTRASAGWLHAVYLVLVPGIEGEKITTMTTRYLPHFHASNQI